MTTTPTPTPQHEPSTAPRPTFALVALHAKTMTRIARLQQISRTDRGTLTPAERTELSRARAQLRQVARELAAPTAGDQTIDTALAMLEATETIAMHYEMETR